MNLDTLRLYCDVVRLRSFSRGAAANSVSQSAASQAIQQLEAELDVALLDRSRRPPQATGWRSWTRKAGSCRLAPKATSRSA